MADIEEKEDDYNYDSTGVSGRNVHLPPTGEVDNHLSHQLQDVNKNITKAEMHDSMSSSQFYSNTSSLLQSTKLSRNDYENTYYQKGKILILIAWQNIT